MSKLLELIKISPTDKMYADLKPLSGLCEVDEEYSSLKYAMEYRIKATFGANVIVNEPSQLPYAVEQVKRSVCEAVFGEFREPLREIQRLLWQREYSEVSSKLAQLEANMFSL